ncbi:MAG: DUF362 domain-containing protein [Asgard group archaeon]|nr:DUF362 domain-containing protein [Asgard group archaeon]
MSFLKPRNRHLKHGSNSHSCVLQKSSKRDRFKKSLLVFLFLNIFWLIFRTGTKPSRIVYPCQRAALRNISIAVGTLVPLLTFSLIGSNNKRQWLAKGKTFLIVFLIIAPVTSGIIIQKTTSYTEAGLEITPFLSDADFSSDIFVVNGPEVAHIEDLFELMGTNGLLFYQSPTSDLTQGPAGLIAPDDVVLIKNNCQWSERGGTNTDLIYELIQIILDHPDGFTGEIVIADNGQGRGRMNWGRANAEDHSQSAQTVANNFSSLGHDVSTYLWDTIKNREVDEYSDGDNQDGYVVFDSADPESGIYVSYPKFNTTFGTSISFKNGIWNGTDYEQKLKIINMPVLKTHSGFGVTAAMKHYMGVQSQGVANGHQTIATGSMGTLMAELGIPTLNILDAIWINANPAPSIGNGPSTGYGDATRVNIIMASLDPIALDYWAAKHILLQAAILTEETGTHTISPDNTLRSGLEEAFGVWLNLSKSELLLAGYNVTSNESEMNIFANSLVVDIGVAPTGGRIWLWVGIGSSIGVIAIVATVLTISTIRKKKKM